ncbi:MAG: hypothetical protein LLF89_05345 [Spirochaetaceae bacterium]|nr:hypothetical protein [Spirochaetaceae bacterium]
MDKSVEEFWEEFEKETGEKVLAKTMGQSFSSSNDRGDWGLLVVTPTCIRFRKTPGENWFATLFKTSRPKVPVKSEEDLVIPFSSIVSLVPPPRKFLDFLFGSPFFTFTVHYKTGFSEELAETPVSKIRFAVDPKSDFFVQLKQKAGLP